MKALLALAALAALALAGCSGATNEGTGTTDATSSAPAPPMEDGKYVIRLTSANKFVPAEATIPAGSTVVWVVDGGVHDVTEGHDGDTWAWSSDDDNSKLTPGDRYERKFDEKGTVEYRCIVHASAKMLGTLTVA